MTALHNPICLLPQLQEYPWIFEEAGGRLNPGTQLLIAVGHADWCYAVVPDGTLHIAREYMVSVSVSDEDCKVT
jgi:hypothetical protein